MRLEIKDSESDLLRRRQIKQLIKVQHITLRKWARSYVRVNSFTGHNRKSYTPKNFLEPKGCRHEGFCTSWSKSYVSRWTKRKTFCYATPLDKPNDTQKISLQFYLRSTKNDTLTTEWICSLLQHQVIEWISTLNSSRQTGELILTNFSFRFHHGIKVVTA